MTKSAVMVKPLRAFKVVVGFESSVVKGELPGRIDKCKSKQGRTTLGHTGRFSGKLPGLANSRSSYILKSIWSSFRCFAR